MSQIQLKRLSILGFFLSLSIMPSLVAANSFVQFNLASQPLDKALVSFAKQANTTVIFSYDITHNYHSIEIKGYYTPKSALNKLLKNTALVATMQKNGSFSIANSTQTSTNNVSDRQPREIKPHKNNIEQISILGTRSNNRTVNNIPVPVDIIPAEMLQLSGHKTLGKALQSLAPSFNFPSSVISDGTDVLTPATLRGLGPDQTLVLINGKRRHQASLIHINTSVGKGTAGTDMNVIPIAAIKRIEVLRDGAAAQYGSDAIAGVINIVLNDGNTPDKLTLNYGKYAEGDGGRRYVDFTKTLKFNDQSYLNSTIQYINKDWTNRAGLNGTCLYNGCEDIGNKTQIAFDDREVNAPRRTFQIGDAESEHLSLALNGEYAADVGDFESFFTYSNRKNTSAAFFRDNINPYANPTLSDGDALAPQGFLPKIQTDIEDISYSLSYGIDIEETGSINFSYTYGKNSIDYKTANTFNPSYANFLSETTTLSPNEIRLHMPRKADAYGLELSLSTLNIDYQQYFDTVSFALGAEYRTDKYKVTTGKEYAYKDYDTFMGSSLYGFDANSGTEGFGGIGKNSQVDKSRDVYSIYLDIEHELTDNFILSTALRYDNYHHCCESLNYKIAANWSLSEALALRGAISTGFRAPSMQQLYYNSVSTQFVNISDNSPENTITSRLSRAQELTNQQSLQVGTFGSESNIARTIGLPELNEETSQNFSLGTVFQPDEKINITLDLYHIEIEDRIIFSKKLVKGLNADLDAALIDIGADAGQFFFNGADTKTQGVDLVASWNTELLQNELNLTFAANYTETKVEDIYVPASNTLSNIEVDNIFSEQDVSIIEEWQPQDRISVNALYKTNTYHVNISLNRYGKYTITDGEKQTYGAEILTDIQLSFPLNSELTLSVGGNNIFDVTPDKNEIGNARAGTILDENGQEIVSSDGVFQYSRRSAPFGFNGAYFYGEIAYQF